MTGSGPGRREAPVRTPPRLPTPTPTLADGDPVATASGGGTPVDPVAGDDGPAAPVAHPATSGSNATSATTRDLRLPIRIVFSSAIRSPDLPDIGFTKLQEPGGTARVDSHRAVIPTDDTFTELCIDVRTGDDPALADIDTDGAAPETPRRRIRTAETHARVRRRDRTARAAGSCGPSDVRLGNTGAGRTCNAGAAGSRARA
jgi:hypothetical protein